MRKHPTPPATECVPHIVAEAWIAVVIKHPRAPEESISASVAFRMSCVTHGANAGRPREPCV